MGKYKLKKHTYINWVIVLIFLMIALIFINIGYSLWTTKLNIFGKVTLDLNVPQLEVTVPKATSNSYIHMQENNGFKIIRDEYSENTLTTTIKIDETQEKLDKLKLTFSMKNISKTDENYIDGKASLVEHSSDNAISNVFANLSKGIIENGSSDTFNFSADIEVSISLSVRGRLRLAS